MDKKRVRRESDRGAYDWVQLLVCCVVTVVVIFTFVMRVVRVDGPSMRETLQDRDLLAVVNSPLCGSCGAGDIVIIRQEDFLDGAPIVKRVIATEGQTVDIDFDTGTVYVDGEALDEDYIREPTFTDEGMDYPLTVPEGAVFVMGDKRNDSHDSRAPDLGPVDTRYIMGRAVAVLIPGVSADTGSREWFRAGILS